MIGIAIANSLGLNFLRGIFGPYKSRVEADGGITEAGQCVEAGATPLLQTASLLLIPSGYKANKLYSEIPTNGNGDLTWTRTSTAIRTNSSGLLESMGSGVPRLSYMYGSCPSVLLEPQRTNLALRSEEFDDASWTKVNTSVTANSTTSPDGTTDADTFTGNGSLALHGVTRTVTVTINTVYTVSVYAKKNTNGFIQIAGASGLFGSTVYANYDLNNGVVGNTGGGITASIQSVGNGWYRCIMTATSGGSVTSSTFGYYLITSSTAVRAENNSLATSVYLFGSQFEAGAYPTTYIPTTSATATRIADSFSRNNIYTNGLITSSGGTWFVELRNNIVYTRDNSIVGYSIRDSVSTTSGNNLEIRCVSGSPQRISIGKRISGVSTPLFLTTTGTVKIAIKWNGTSADIFVNGVKQVSATAYTTTLMEFFSADGGDVPKFIQQMALFPTPLSDTDCTTITTL